MKPLYNILEGILDIGDLDSSIENTAIENMLDKFKFKSGFYETTTIDDYGVSGDTLRMDYRCSILADGFDAFAKAGFNKFMLNMTGVTPSEVVFRAARKRSKVNTLPEGIEINFTAKPKYYWTFNGCTSLKNNIIHANCNLNIGANVEYLQSIENCDLKATGDRIAIDVDENCKISNTTLTASALTIYRPYNWWMQMTDGSGKTHDIVKKIQQTPKQFSLSDLIGDFKLKGIDDISLQGPNIRGCIKFRKSRITTDITIENGKWFVDCI